MTTIVTNSNKLNFAEAVANFISALNSNTAKVWSGVNGSGTEILQMWDTDGTAVIISCPDFTSEFLLLKKYDPLPEYTASCYGFEVQARNSPASPWVSVCLIMQSYVSFSVGQVGLTYNAGSNTVMLNLTDGGDASYSTESWAYTLTPAGTPANGAINLTAVSPLCTASLEGVELGPCGATFDQIAPGTGTLVITRLGFQSWSQSITIASGSTTTPTVTMVPATGGLHTDDDSRLNVASVAAYIRMWLAGEYIAGTTGACPHAAYATGYCAIIDTGHENVVQVVAHDVSVHVGVVARNLVIVKGDGSIDTANSHALPEFTFHTGLGASEIGGVMSAYYTDAARTQAWFGHKIPSSEYVSTTFDLGAVSTTGAVSVTCADDSASIWYGGHNYGPAPVTIIGVPPGAATVTAKHPGYEDVSIDVTVVAAQTVTAALGAGAGNSNDVGFSSDPSGAEVYVDATLVGTTPCTVQLSTGDHTIQWKLTGYKDSTPEVVSVIGATTVPTKTLVALEAGATCALTITSNPSGATALVDRTVVGVTPITVDVTRATHTIEATKVGYELWSQSVNCAAATAQVGATLVVEGQEVPEMATGFRIINGTAYDIYVALDRVCNTKVAAGTSADIPAAAGSFRLSFSVAGTSSLIRERKRSLATIVGGLGSEVAAYTAIALGATALTPLSGLFAALITTLTPAAADQALEEGQIFTVDISAVTETETPTTIGLLFESLGLYGWAVENEDYLVWYAGGTAVGLVALAWLLFGARE